MHKKALNKEQIELLPLIKKFSDSFILVGGTAIALHLGHRRSVDFDLFTNSQIDLEKIRNIVRNEFKIEQTLVEEPEELTIVANGVKITFYRYPFDISLTEVFEGSIKLPNILTLAAMKAFALGRRAKWKDYVDLYFISKEHTLEEVVGRAKRMFRSEFNEKLFRAQLAYFDDIDYSEKIEYMPSKEMSDLEIKETLVKLSLEDQKIN